MFSNLVNSSVEFVFVFYYKRIDDEVVNDCCIILWVWKYVLNEEEEFQ